MPCHDVFALLVAYPCRLVVHGTLDSERLLVARGIGLSYPLQALATRHPGWSPANGPPYFRTAAKHAHWGPKLQSLFQRGMSVVIGPQPKIAPKKHCVPHT